MTTEALLSATAPLRALIRKTETARDGAAAYNTIIHHREGDLAKPLTSMTVDEVLAAQLVWVRKWKMPSGAAGGYQIIRKTLTRLKKALGLAGSEKFTPDLQDRMAVQLLIWRGVETFLAGRLGEKEFGLELAKEWASFPVFKRMKGMFRQVVAGQSYYAGDGVNHALVKPAEVLAVLRQVRPPKGGRDPAPVEPAFPQRGAKDDEQVALVQRRLKELGYVEVGNVDGDFGEFTEKAILLFRHDAGLPLNAGIDEALIVALSKAKPRPVPAARENATPAEVREQVPEARDSWWSKVLSFWGMVGAFVTAAVQFVVSSFSDAKSLVKPIADTFGVVPWWIWLALIGAGLLTIWLKSKGSEQKAVVAYQEGARR